MPDHKNDFQPIIDTARQASTQVFAEFPGVLVTHSEMRINNLEALSANPSRPRGTVIVHNPASLITALNDLGAEQMGAAIFVDRDPSRPAIEAILNYDADGMPGWRDHRIVLELRPTPEWNVWNKMNDRFIGQTEFAEFIEDNQHNIHTPAGAHLLELVQKLEITSNNDFKSAINLGTGEVQFSYNENHTAKVGSGLVTVPKQFTLGLRPYVGSATYDVKANFRHRLREGKLSLGFKLMQTDKIVEDVVNDIVTAIEKGTNISIYEGRAPDAVEPFVGTGRRG